MEDVGTVMDAAGSERATLIGHGHAAQMVLMFAATYPERVDSLVLMNGFARLTRDRRLSGRRAGGDPWAPHRRDRAAVGNRRDGRGAGAVDGRPAGASGLVRARGAQCGRVPARDDDDARETSSSTCARSCRSSTRRPSSSRTATTKSSAPVTATTWPSTFRMPSCSSARAPTTGRFPIPISSARSRSSSPARDRRPTPSGSWRRCSCATWPARRNGSPRSATSAGGRCGIASRKRCAASCTRTEASSSTRPATACSRPSTGLRGRSAARVTSGNRCSEAASTFEAGCIPER